MEPGSLSSTFTDLASKRLSRLIWLCVLAVTVIALGSVFVPWSFSFSTAALRNEASTQIRQTTGLATLSQGRAVFALLPQPHIKVEKISFGDSSGALHIDAEYFKGNLRVLPLLVGRLEIANATLLKPRLTIDLDSKHLPVDSAIGRAAEAKPDSEEAAVADTARLGMVSLVDGTARITAKSMPADVTIDNIDMTLDWTNLNAPASLTGKVRFRGESGDIAAWIAAPAELLRGGRSQMTLDVKAGILQLTTNGALSMAPKPEFSGHLRATSQALPKLLALIGYPISMASPLAGFQLASDAKGNANGVSFSNLNLSLAGSDFEGSLAIEAGRQKPLLSGTLATDLLTLDPFFAHLQPFVDKDQQWSEQPFDFHTLNTADLDLRVSAARTRLSHFEMQDAAMSLITHDDRMDISMAQAKAYRGLLKARATLNIGQEGPSLHAAGSIIDLDAGALSWDMTGVPELTGLASATATIDALGGNLLQFVQHLDGRIQAKLKQGDVRSADVNRIFKGRSIEPAAQTNPFAAAVPYDQAQFGIKIVKGTAEIEQGLVDGPGGHVLLSGTAALTERKIDFRAVVIPASSIDPLAPVPQSQNIIVRGPWDHPLITPATPN